MCRLMVPEVMEELLKRGFTPLEVSIFKWEWAYEYLIKYPTKQGGVGVNLRTYRNCALCIVHDNDCADCCLLSDGHVCTELDWGVPGEIGIRSMLTYMHLLKEAGFEG